MEPIPRDVALEICRDIEQTSRIFSQCWACVRLAKGDPDRMGFAGGPDHRGCELINRVYDRGKAV